MILDIILDREEPMGQICKETEEVSVRLEQMVRNAVHATVMRSNFGIKSFYRKIGGYVLIPKFGSRGKNLEVWIHQERAEIFSMDQLTKLPSNE